MEFLQDHMVMREEFDVLKQDVNVLKQDVNVLKQDVGVLKQDVGVLKQDVVSIRQDMNKMKLDILDAVDDKLADLKGDLIVMMRAEDQKNSALVKILHKRRVITDAEAQAILVMRPFPQAAG